jgi:Tfp pilus assembly protein PilZ
MEQGDLVLEVRGEVVWAQEQDTPEQAAGMGIRFGKLSLDERRAISRFVQDAAFEG